MTFRVIKTYGHEEGLSCCFRQWQAADSHCRFLHGYALSFAFTFAADTLDHRGWVIDFGGLAPLRAWLHETFDHTLIAASDDPALPAFRALTDAGLADLRILPATGCESFARYAHARAERFVAEETAGRVRVNTVAVREHAGNEASFSTGHA